MSGRKMAPHRTRWPAFLGLSKRQRRSLTSSLAAQLDQCADDSARRVLYARPSKQPTSYPRVANSRAKKRSEMSRRYMIAMAHLAERITGDPHWVERVDKRWTVFREDASGKEILAVWA